MWINWVLALLNWLGMVFNFGIYAFVTSSPNSLAMGLLCGFTWIALLIWMQE